MWWRHNAGAKTCGLNVGGSRHLHGCPTYNQPHPQIPPEAMPQLPPNFCHRRFLLYLAHTFLPAACLSMLLFVTRVCCDSERFHSLATTPALCLPPSARECRHASGDGLSTHVKRQSWRALHTQAACCVLLLIAAHGCTPPAPDSITLPRVRHARWSAPLP
jgi:hypothetical protein